MENSHGCFLLDFDQFKVIFAGTAFRANPVDRHVFPAGAGLDAFIGYAHGFVVDEATDQAHVGFVFGGVVRGHCSDSFQIELHFKSIAPPILVADTPPIVLSFAASDPSGGAGVQADLMTLASLGVHPLSVITALTVQDTMGVEDTLAIDADWISDQARCVLEDVPVGAFKVGLVASVESVATIAEIVADYPDVPLVLDPVLASGRGDELASEDVIAAMCELLLPQTTVLTPNSHEARRLASEDSEEAADLSLDECAAALLDMGPEYVLVTGTHENTVDVSNALFTAGGLVRTDRWKRLPGSYHGSGCTLAAAIAANIAHGLDIPDAVHSAQEYTWQTLRFAYRAGMGQLVPDRFFWARDDEAADEGRPD